MFGSKIKLDKDLLERCKSYAKDAGYSSVEEFISHTLEKELGKLEGKGKEDDNRLKKRLRGLGYID